MRHRHAAFLAILLVAFSAVPATAAPRGAGGERATHERIVRFWTPARMRAAVPRDIVRSAPGRAPTAKPAGKGKPGGGGQSGGSTVTGAAWTKGGKVRDAVGKVFFRLDGTLYTCSGSVANDGRSGYSLVLTAAHCAFDERADVFATNWLFIPDYGSAPTSRCDDTRHGCWTALALVVHQGFAAESSFTDQATRHDFAFAVVGAGGRSGQSRQLDATVGSFPITFNAAAESTRLYAFGYPASGKYKGSTLVYCAGQVTFDGSNGDATYGLGCDMTGGSSGGPWFSGFDETTGNGTLTSLNSYGYSGVKAMFGPKFNAKTQAVYAAADSTISNRIVS